MGFIPKDAKWYLAHIVEEIRVEGDHRNVVHTNQILVRSGFSRRGVRQRDGIRETRKYDLQKSARK